MRQQRMNRVAPGSCLGRGVALEVEEGEKGRDGDGEGQGDADKDLVQRVIPIVPPCPWYQWGGEYDQDQGLNDALGGGQRPDCLQRKPYHLRLPLQRVPRRHPSRGPASLVAASRVKRPWLIDQRLQQPLIQDGAEKQQPQQEHAGGAAVHDDVRQQDTRGEPWHEAQAQCEQRQRVQVEAERQANSHLADLELFIARAAMGGELGICLIAQQRAAFAFGIGISAHRTGIP
mmetsp:Transcript_104165/g.262029  ORF Transcript_104165/g.262029 Transcript_104165/m.262029 type:complete len:231 (-) Transcript_104165:84-776(-)